jgi:hypothetical protein
MRPAGFEPTISETERPQTYVLDRAATGIGQIITVIRRRKHKGVILRYPIIRTKPTVILSDFVLLSVVTTMITLNLTVPCTVTTVVGIAVVSVLHYSKEILIHKS